VRPSSEWPMASSCAHFSRVYFQALPDFSTLQRWAQTIRPETLHTLNDRVVELAREAKVTKGRKLRIDGTVMETTIHHPTDRNLLADGVRVLSRVIHRCIACCHRLPRYHSYLSGFVIRLK